ncbi:uncharacterized protein LOC119248653 [Talpa occidentalis]|uniref:uncharacterized protein LOC119248653 n=1 Tax=Talpa occidentalis TaxID=50954 RepID=UPI0023F7958A|nr:uncharacterized protein LOC119248653 [Talpa occidentalis]
MCPTCSPLGKCTEINCPSSKESCLLSQKYLSGGLENGALIRNGSCVAAEECPKGVYMLTFGPYSWLSKGCCESNCSKAFHQGAETEAQPNGVKCPYCSGNESAPCGSGLVLNCTGKQTVCAILNGTWSGGDHQTLKGCATPEICHLPENTILGPVASGFHLSTQPECSIVAPSAQPGYLAPHTEATENHEATRSHTGATESHTRATVTHSNTTKTHNQASITSCFTCSDPYHCVPLHCPEDKNYCLQNTGITVLGEQSRVSWRNGSCVASRDCKFENSISAFTNGFGDGFWVSTTCCRGHCQAPILFEALPASKSLSRFLCPTCPGNSSGPCNSSLYLHCPRVETECIQLDLVHEGGGNLTLRGCGSRDLCGGARARTPRLPELPAPYRLARPPRCSASRRVLLRSKGHSVVSRGLPLTLRVLALALATRTLF